MVKTGAIGRNGLTKVPMSLIRKLENMGIDLDFAVTYITANEIDAASPLWEKFVEALQDLKGVPVDVTESLRYRLDDPLYDSPDDHDHTDELFDLMLEPHRT